MTTIKEQLLEYVQQPDYRPLRANALAKKIGVTKKKIGEFEEALAEAVASGDLRITETERIQGKPKKGSYLGILRRIKSGAGFVIMHDPKPTDFEGDVFVEEADMKDAQSGDEVLIQLNNRRRGGGTRCGFVVDVVERATNIFVGTYMVEQDAGWVYIDGKDFSEPVWVGDPGAKGALEGDKVVIEMIRFPSKGEVGEGVLTKVLGARGAEGVETQLIIHQFAIPDEFPDAVLDEARIEAENFNEAIVGEREDLTKLNIVTIDPKTARDFDDAISLERTSDRHWHLGVHIADVSHFVQPGSALDREAELRGTSVYLPTKVIPMLPEVISNGLASLQEKKVRYTMSAFIEFTMEGIPINTRFSRSAIKVNKRFAYEEVLPIIEEKDEAKVKHIPEKVRKLLHDMQELARILRKRRFVKGALELEMPEVRLDLDPIGNVSGAHEEEHDESHEIIEEFMLAANIAVATELNDRGHNFLRRTHASPNEAKLKSLAEFATILGYPIKSVQSRKDLQNMLNQVKGQPEQQSLNYAFLRSLKQAEYSPEEIGHYALAEEQYCHFTSPIRRYPDLLIHRLMASIVCDNDAYKSPSYEELLRIGRNCSNHARRAEKAERELTKIKLLSYLEERIGEQMEAVITGVDRYGFFCRGILIPAEGLVHISTIPGNDHYEFDRAQMALVGRGTGELYRLGDKVKVQVSHVDVDQRELNFKLVEHQSRPKTAIKKPPSGQPDRGSKPGGKRPKPGNKGPASKRSPSSPKKNKPKGNQRPKKS